MTKTLRTLCVLMTIMLWPMAAMAQTIYVDVEAKGTGDGSSWDNATKLEEALANAQKNDEIWVKKGTYKVPDDKLSTGFTLKSGVRLYGGFYGDETSVDQRTVIGDKAYRMANQTILFGDIDDNDSIDATNLIFPSNTTRANNANHVLTLDVTPTQTSGNNNREETIVDGITIAGGHNTGGNGGGIIVTGDNSSGGAYVIRRCFFIGNYATQGGALYVENNVTNANGTCLIDRCGFFNNAAGTRGVAENHGGAIYLAGAGTVVNSAIFNNENGGIYLGDNNNAQVINSTVTRNTASGIDGQERTVVNTVIWGNSTLSTDGERPNFLHCAYPEVNAEGAQGTNVYLAAKNNEADGPHFSSPSLKTGFDTSFDIAQQYPLWTWEPMEATPLVDAGDNGSFTSIGIDGVDLNGDTRIQGSAIDIGAFEYQPVADGRIRYVKKDGTGDGSSWANASGDIQRMIDDLADNNPQNLPGEVWVAAGTYEPQTQLITGTSYSASFRMRDGISVYGGFIGGESSKTERTLKIKGNDETVMPWEFQNETILMAAYYDHENLKYNNKWTLTSDSRHVVWFAPMRTGNENDGYEFEEAFNQPTYLDGVTIVGGYAQGGTGLDEFLTDRGAGVYMNGENTYLTNCVVKENYATGNGGGVYVSGGRVQSSLIYNNNSDQNGGAVYVDDRGLVHRSMLTNNSARNGAGVYLDNQAPTAGGDDHPEYLILSTCVVSNNTASGNGTVYCDEGGVLLQNTITNNQCVTATDATDPNASQTGGIYINSYALVVNSVIWNNHMGENNDIPMYAKNPTAATVRFMYNAISGVNNAVWNNVLQQQTLSLSGENAVGDDGSMGPRFEEDGMPTLFGVQGDWKDLSIDYFWKPVKGSTLWARGMALGQLPQEVVLAPEIDIEGALFNQKPAVGAFSVAKSDIVPSLELNTDNNNYKLVIYIDAECTDPDHHGSSWATAYRSLNDAISYLAELTNESEPEVLTSDGTEWTIPSMDIIESFEIRVLEGNLWPRYAFVNEDPKTATVDILKMQSDKSLRIVGGYYRTTDDNTAERDPLNHRSQLNGNPDGDSLEDGLYHVVTVESGAKVELDGFHIINGYAAGSATLQYGAGMLVHPDAEVTVANTIFENNTAVSGAAIYADPSATLTLQNCVVNNNTNVDTETAVVNSSAERTTMHHVTIVNNIGAAVVNESLLQGSSFSKGNDSNNSIDSEILATIGAEGAQNFANPTNNRGATLGFDTYLGGYSSFRPLTSSSAAAEYIINKVSTDTDTGLDNDIMGNERDLGGVPDLGAYEADLPKAGKVIYVRSYNQEWEQGEELDGNPDVTKGGDGTSWNTAINGNVICDVEEDMTEDLGFYARASNRNFILSTEQNYTGTYGFDTDFYADFWDTDGNTYSNRGRNRITNNRKEQYISGLQYAVEKAAELNDNLQPGEDSVEVWVGAGIYTDYKGFVIRDKVKVLGGFPNTGIPGESDRHPLISQYISANENDSELEKTDYETILQIRKETPVTWTWNSREGHVEGRVTSIVTNLGNTVRRRYVLFQPDVCLPTWAPANNYGGTDGRDNQYRFPGSGSGLIDNDNYVEYGGAMWDGFTVRHGYINRYYSNRDGGAGVRVFRGVTLQNMVIVNNCNRHNNRNRGAGLYMDGLNSRINNSFIMNNYIGTEGESMGGGAYMIVGTGYNLVVAKNYSSHRGGGIFMESATFFNNTIAYNYVNWENANSDGGGGSGLFQYADGNQRPSNLELYNCLFYGNYGVSISSNTPGTFNDAYNCYVQGSLYTGISDKFRAENGNLTGDDANGNPFEDYNSYTNNDFRLKDGSSCVNNGTLQAGNVVINLPSTDMDYTNRIKDCTVDIGAYERDNEDTTFPDENGVYYVTWTGFGDASADSPQNAACADKLQTVLDAAGERAALRKAAIVKIAGYTDEEFVYHANTLADPSNPQSYTFVVPEGVTVMGGYFEGTFPNGNYNNDGWDDADEDHKRNAMTYRTVLSAEAVPTQGSTITQNVTGYHAVTFGKGDGTAALTKPAIIDGVWLTDGSATSMAGAGNANTQGGGAIVPEGAHVRNCVVTGNSAVAGGGLYVLPGGTVSGTLVYANTADNGGGIYADNGNTESGTDDNRAHIISCTIAGNTADNGGGLYLEDGAAMSLNTVIWGNTAPSDKNVSGVTNERYRDSVLQDVLDLDGKYYPFNDCFVETREMESDFENSSMESDSTMYFIDTYRLKEFSPLIKHGLNDDYQSRLQATFGVAEKDMQGILRSQDMGRLDAGAFAYDGGILPTDLFTRIFVSQTTNVKLREDEDMLKYLGKSFYTSFSTLEDALAYVRSMREGEHPKANNDTHFEILVSGGTYKPTYMRVGENASTSVTHDQRLYSFVIPQNVSIYGGFSGTENYITPEDMQYPEVGEDKITSIPSDEITDGVDGSKDLITILSMRGSSDFNNNGIEEPWELENQTILSGAINVSSTAKNAYHVLFSNESGATNPAVLDGLTVMDGETYNDMTDVADYDEAGRGGGLYSNGVPYTINRCRFINNFGVRGGAVYMRDARLNVIGSVFAGNGTVDNPQAEVDYQKPRGGAIFLAGLSEKDAYASLYAVNSLFVNNETTGEGGAIGTNYAESVVTNYDPKIDIMNCTFAKNKAQTNAVFYNHNGKSQLTNILIWGNESEDYNEETDAGHFNISHSASDHNYDGKFGENDELGSVSSVDNNILLDKNNTATYGPRFMRPATVAGVEGNDATNLWNPSAISIVTDKGDGINPEDNNNQNDAYTSWLEQNGLQSYSSQYMCKPDGSGYNRYSGPLDEETGQTGDRPIDIGIYEYQYFNNFQTKIKIYVATEEAGNGDGSTWAHATSDLRGAIVGASNPEQNSGDRTIYVRDGIYELQRLSGGTAFTANMSNSNLSNGLTIKGSCTGVGLGDAAQQNFANQSIIRNFDGTNTNTLFAVRANYGKYVTVEGFTFVNESGTGIDASTTQAGSKFILANSTLRMNETGVNISANNGSVLIYNTLFADGVTGLSATSKDNITLVNTTFANNGTDMSDGLTNVYNSVSWNNVMQNMQGNDAGTEKATYNNKVFAHLITDEVAEDNNEYIQNGPNFVDPLNENKELRDYHIRPSLTLLNQGDNGNYLEKVIKVVSGNDEVSDIPDTERDLGNNARLTDTNIDIGAYEYEAPLQPIVYVRDGLTVSNPDGSSWDLALDDLQGAVDLAGLYAHNNDEQNGYVFVDKNVDAGTSETLRVSLPNTKVYGGMNRETSTTGIYEDDGTTISTDNVKTIVSELLNEREGLIEGNDFSTLNNVTVNASSSVVDGFEVNGAATVNNGYLSTSVVNNGVSGNADGILYNTLVYGDVLGVTAVNVTAIGKIGNGDNNRASVTETNNYVTDAYWNYQLNETDTANIDGGGNQKATNECINMVGHNRDIAGNKRIRNVVDNGCFETWNITPQMTTDGNNVVTSDDYPRGKSVVYVRKAGEGDTDAAELSIDREYTTSEPFNPGVLLLEHRAGLRGKGNNVGLSYVIMERDIKADDVDMAYAPFAVNELENNSNVALMYYDGSKRADYNYPFDDKNGKAWTDKTDNFSRIGLLLDNTEGSDIAHVRFIGKVNGTSSAHVYEEGSGMNVSKVVSLKKENHSDPWTSSPGTSNKFTAKENMSWNLFGSPYLCAMNYSDMEYGRVIYGYDVNSKVYKTINTDEATTPEGYIPAGDAVFTQTATLKDYEDVNIDISAGKSGVPYQGMAALTLSISRTGDTRSADDGGADGDVLQLNAVAPEMSRTDFDMGADGVKWMADGVAQIYATQGGGRYSLLSAVNVEGRVGVGVTLPEAGMYTIAVPDDCRADGYESVILEDAANERSVDLLEGGYDFTSTTAGDIEGRFSISFNRMIDDARGDGIRAWSPSRGAIRVEGVEPGDRISIYSVDGIRTTARIAASSTEDFSTDIVAVAVVTVEREGDVVKTVKLKMKY